MQLAIVRALTWADTASVRHLSDDHAGWRFVLDIELSYQLPRTISMLSCSEKGSVLAELLLICWSEKFRGVHFCRSPDHPLERDLSVH